MSNRQERIQRKAKKRKQRLLEAVAAIQPPEGFSVSAGLYDFGYRLGVAVCDDSRGARYGVFANLGRKARRMEHLPQQMTGGLFRLAAGPDGEWLGMQK